MTEKIVRIVGSPRDDSDRVVGRQFSSAKFEVCVEKPPAGIALTTGHLGHHGGGSR